jgi:hypothetical protein
VAVEIARAVDADEDDVLVGVHDDISCLYTAEWLVFK